MKERACLAGALAGLFFTAALHAETLYVIDQLIVSVSSTAEEAAERIATIRSGDAVQVLDRREGFAHIRLASGTDGWVKASYLSAEPPLQQKLTAQLGEIERLKQEVARLQGEASAARVAPVVARALPENRSVPPADEQPRDTPPMWHWVVGAALAALVCGFAIGWRMLDRRIRRKYGGLRIY